MANTLSAKKRARQAEKRRCHSSAQRSLLRTSVKNVRKAVLGGDKDAANKAYLVAIPVIDKMVNKGVIHKNKAARFKSRLNGHVKKLGAA